MSENTPYEHFLNPVSLIYDDWKKALLELNGSRLKEIIGWLEERGYSIDSFISYDPQSFSYNHYLVYHLAHPLGGDAEAPEKNRWRINFLLEQGMSVRGRQITGALPADHAVMAFTHPQSTIDLQSVGTFVLATIAQLAQAGDHPYRLPLEKLLEINWKSERIGRMKQIHDNVRRRLLNPQTEIERQAAAVAPLWWKRDFPVNAQMPEAMIKERIAASFIRLAASSGSVKKRNGINQP